MLQGKIERQAAAPDRRPPAATLVQRSPTTVATPIQAIQQRVGSQGMHALVARSAASATATGAEGLRVSAPTDVAEREATAMAAAVMRSPSPVAEATVAPVSTIQRAPALAAAPVGAGQPAPAPVAAAIAGSMGGGAPLVPSVRSFMEPRFGANFGQVRVHTGENAARLSSSLNASAFTVGNHIFFGRNQFQPDRPQGRELIAHELTHTVQQGAVAQRSIQREESKPGILSRIGGAISDAAGAVLPSASDLVMTAVGYVAPSLVPLISGGPGGFLQWIKDKAVFAIEGVFNRFMAPVNAIAGVGTNLTAQVAPVIQALQVATGQIAKNECGPIRDAAEKLEKAAERLITPIVELLQPVVAAIKDFFTGVWNAIGAPIWDWIKDYAGAQWQMIKDIANWIGKAAKWLWDNTASIRAVYVEAWAWLKNKLGIGDGPEGENGILQWVQGKLSEAWDAIKARLAPFSKQITVIAAAVGGVLLALSPAGPIIAIGAAVGGTISGLRWIAANWGKGNIIAQARIYLEKTLIPPLLESANRLGATFAGIVASLTGGLNSLAASLMGAVGVVGSSLLSFAVSAVQWVASQVAALAAWANSKLANLGAWLSGALQKLQNLLEGVLKFLGRVADVIIDIYALPVFLGEAIWNAVPACLRDPIVDFLGPIILRQIEIFQELGKDNEAWQKTKADVAKIIKQVFHDHDLTGAIKSTFFLILRVFNLPPDLLVTVGQKALAAWDVVIKKPIEFIKNTVRAIGHGFKFLWDNKIENLKLGLQGWLFGEIKEKNIAIPTKWDDPRQLFDLALSVLGINTEHIFELLKKRFNDKTIEKIRTLIGRAAGVVAWVDKAIDTTKTPTENTKGMIAQAKDFGVTILTGLAEWVAAKVAEEVAIMLAAAAATAGLSEVVDIVRRIYRAILTAVRWARRILDMANQALDNVLDLAGGAVEKVGAVFYKIMRGGLPVMVGFLADQVGLGGVGAAIRGIIDKLREKVDNAILWVIDKIKVALEKIVGAVKAGVAAVLNWWGVRKPFTANDGKQHEMFFRGTGRSSVLMMASDEPTGLLDRIDKRSGELSQEKPVSAAALTSLKTARQLVVAMNDYTAKHEAKPPSEKGAETETIRDEIDRRLDVIRPHLVAGKIIRSTDELPLTNITYQMEGAKAWKVIADPLTTHPGNTTGAEAGTSSAAPQGWRLASTENSQTFVENGGKKLSPDWKRVHLMSAQFHGPANVWNLVPARTAVNASMLSVFETPVKTRLATKEMKAEVEVRYYAEATRITITRDEEVIEEAKASDYPESIFVTLQEKTPEGAFVKIRDRVRIPGTNLPQSGSVDANLELTLQRQKVAIDIYVAELHPPLRPMAWSKYYSDSIHSRVRARLGPERMGQLESYYAQKLAERGIAR